MCDKLKLKLAYLYIYIYIYKLFAHTKKKKKKSQKQKGFFFGAFSPNKLQNGFFFFLISIPQWIITTLYLLAVSSI